MPPDPSPIGKGHALWLTPDQPIFSHLAREISRLSQQLSTPCFEPHITLLSQIILPERKALGRSAELARCIRPFRIELAEIDQLDEFFRCLFVTVHPTAAVLKTRHAACRFFARRWEPYAPHLSLVYGKLPADRKREIVRSPSLLQGHAFEVSKIALYRVNGPVRLWKCVEQLDLK